MRHPTPRGSFWLVGCALAAACGNGTTGSLDSASNAACGDGKLDAAESCDDGNSAGGDGCSAVCAGEAGFACSGEPAQCVANGDMPAAPTTSDFFQLAVVPDQTVTAASFEVQVIAEDIDPNILPTAPTVIDAKGQAYTMALKTLKWPGTTEDSVTVYAKDIPLVPGLNNLRVTSGTKELAFSIVQKSTLSVLSAANAVDLIGHIKAALAEPSIDIIDIDYDEPDLGNIVHNIGAGIVNKRTTWLTVRPAATRTVSWVRDSGTAMRRPKADFLHLAHVTFGSDSSDGGGGHYYTERLHHIWLSEMEFRAKYKYTWPKADKVTAPYVTDIRALASEGQKVYLTDCSWDGTASIVATSAVQLARDLRFNSHRGDYNNFGKVFLNALAQDAATIRNAVDTDYLHNDGFQIWGSEGTSDLVFKGFKVISPNVGAELQPFLFSRTYTPDYAHVLLDTLVVEGARPTSLMAQFSGMMRDSRISNLAFTTQALALRQDFTEPNGAFAPSNVRIHNVHVKSVIYDSPVAGASKNYDYRAVADTTDISSELNAIATLSGAHFSNIRVAPAP